MGRKGQIRWEPFVIKTRGSKTRISFTKKEGQVRWGAVSE